jgi:magnesium-transporting ATPase (P-type)
VQQADEADATPAECDAALASRLVLVRRDKTQVPIPSEMLLSGELDRLTDETRIPCS